MEAAGVDVEVRAALEAALDVFRSLGATVADVQIPDLAYARATVWTILLSEGLLTHFDLLGKQRERISQRLFQGLAVGLFLSAQDYLRAQQARTLIARQMERAFETLDILLTPSNPSTAAPGTYRPEPKDRKIARSGEAYSTPANLYGNPAVSIPSGFNRLGLPMAIQLAGRPFDEATVLTAAHQFQLATEWHRRRPGLGAIP
jgi:aspartyl-tRNA(Asn)/glutamyl-tRNA(Gln) amidotransferase subunit A